MVIAIIDNCHNLRSRGQSIAIDKANGSHESLGPRGGHRIVIEFLGAAYCNILREGCRNGKAEVKRVMAQIPIAMRV